MEEKTYKDIIEEIKPELEKTIDFLKNELAKIHVGGVSTSFLEDSLIDIFGQKMPLKQLASITSEGARHIIIKPWDQSYVQDIVKSLEKGSLNLSISTEKEIIRVNLPPLSEEYRKDLLKVISEKKEQARITVRRWRDKAWDEIQEGFRAKRITEDEKYRGKDDLQKLVDEYNKKIDEIVERKEKEILEG